MLTLKKDGCQSLLVSFSLWTKSSHTSSWLKRQRSHSWLVQPITHSNPSLGFHPTPQCWVSSSTKRLHQTIAPPGHRAASSPSCSAVALAPAVAARRPTDTRPARSARRPDGSCASPGPSRSSGSRRLPQATSEAMAEQGRLSAFNGFLGKSIGNHGLKCCLKST